MTDSLDQKIASKKAVIGILGLGYVGLSLMQAFGSAGFTVIGYDRNKHKIESLNAHQNYVQGAGLDRLFPLLQKGVCIATYEHEELKGADVFIITVPTSLDVHRLPDLSKVKNASHIIAKYLRKDTLVIVQSTSYPGTTDTDVCNILKESHLKAGEDFYLAFIPEISDFGNTKFDFAKIPKIVGGLCESCAQKAKALYEHITDDVTIVSSAKVAEAAKILQNTYRLINISLINEMKIMFERMGIDIWEVIEAAAKKPFGFTAFYPGPGIGGDCIPVDPYYLVWKARETSGPSTLIELAGEINAQIPFYIVEKTIEALSHQSKSLENAKVLILGVAFKKDVNDIRESASLKILTELQKKGIDVSYHDPYVQELIPSHSYPHLRLSSIKWDSITPSHYDCVLILTDHSSYKWEEIMKHAACIVDTRNVSAPYPHYKHKVFKA